MQTHRPPNINQSAADASPAPAPGGPSLLDELLTADQVAGMLQLRLSTVEDYARRAVLPSVKLGRHRRFIRSEVESAILAFAGQPRTASGHHSPPILRRSPESRSRRT